MGRPPTPLLACLKASQARAAPCALVRREVAEEVGLRVSVVEHFMTCEHAYSHFRVTLHAFHCVSRRGTPRGTHSVANVSPPIVEELGDFPFPAGSMKIIRRLSGTATHARRRAPLAHGLTCARAGL